MTSEPERQLLRDSALRWVAATAPTLDGPGRWRAMAGLGWLAITLPEADGGLGQGLAEACVLAEALGSGPVVEPFGPVVLQAAALIARRGSADQRTRWLPAIAEGRQRVVPALVEPGGHWRSRALRTRARLDGADWLVSGDKRVVPGGDAADAWLVVAGLADDGAAPVGFLVPRGTPGVAVTPYATVDGAGACALELHEVRLEAGTRLADLSWDDLDQAADRALVAACAESVGAMDTLLRATVDWLRTRVQFGRPLAANQALRHRVADLWVACEESRWLTRAAVDALDGADRTGDPVARALAASGARARVGLLARRAAEEAIQLHGGMGVTEEMRVGVYLKRQLALDAMHGPPEWHLRRHAQSRMRQGAGAARAEPAGAAAATGLALTDADRAFRDEVRAFLREELTPDLVRATRLGTSVFSEPDVAGRWQRALRARGWVAPAWPEAFGGTGWSLAQRWIFESECARAGAPSLSPLGLRMVGPVLMRFGTPEQQRRYLPPMLWGEDRWCQGYSEPGSGSDLASLATRARRVREADGREAYRIDGTKLWTTHAHHANRMFALVRTDPDAPRRQDGISFVLIDMTAPGITVRPIRSLSGDHEVNQVFFDDVRVPVHDRIGDEGQGWEIARYLLDFERGGALAGGRLRAALAALRALAARDGALDDPDLALAFSAAEIDVEAFEATELRQAASLPAGGNPGPVASSLLKLRWSELEQSISRLGVRLLGPDALGWEVGRPLDRQPATVPLDDAARPLVAQYLNARAYTIFGGTSEIQREIIARAVLG